MPSLIETQFYRRTSFVLINDDFSEPGRIEQTYLLEEQSLMASPGPLPVFLPMHSKPIFRGYEHEEFSAIS